MGPDQPVTALVERENLGGICLIKAPDLDAALEWGRKATLATTLPIEVRPFMGEA